MFSKAFSFDSAKIFFDSDISIVLEVDNNGNIIQSLQGQNGKIKFISEAALIGDNYFFGSPGEPYLGRLNVKNIKKWKNILISWLSELTCNQTRPG